MRGEELSLDRALGIRAGKPLNQSGESFRLGRPGLEQSPRKETLTLRGEQKRAYLGAELY